MKRFKAIWNDPVGSKVIAYLICGLLSAAVYRLSTCINWPQILKSIIAFWTVGIPCWICFLSLLIVMGICYLLYRK
jgi:hypothetical protein